MGKKGKRIKELRLSLKMTQKDFAEDLSFSKQQIFNYEKDLSEPSAEFIALLLDKYDANPTWVLNGRGGMFILSEKNDPFKAADVTAAYNAKNTFDKICHLLQSLDEDVQKEILKTVQEKILLTELLAERKKPEED